MAEQENENQTPEAPETPKAPATPEAETARADSAEAVAIETATPETETAAEPVATDGAAVAEPVEAPVAEGEIEAETSEPVETQPEKISYEPIGDGPFYGTGRRKTAIARVFLKKGSGEIKVNGRSLQDFFGSDIWRREAVEPLTKMGMAGKFDANITVKGGGSSGQAGAICMGLARALVKSNPNLQPGLRKGGYLTRDARRRERKKYGQKGARRRFQWTKR